MTQLEKELQDVSNVAIARHIHPDGDSVGSCIGLWQYLRDNYPQIKADIWLEQPDNKFSIIEGYEELKQPDGQDRTYDLFISVDCAALDRLGDALPYFQKAKRTFCVDHHVSNHGFADENVILPDASSACEVLCSLMDPEKINKKGGKGAIAGDAVFDEVEPIVEAITPVPGGVGSVTTSVLVGHVVEAAMRKFA